MLVFADGVNITGEGMGIGAVACRHAGFSCFSRGCTTIVQGAGLTERTFLIDSRLLWGRKRPSVLLTRALEWIAGLYMRWPLIQPFLSVTSPARNLLGLKTFFEPIVPVAEARFVYHVDGDTLDISCTIEPGESLTSVILLNELAADSFTMGYCQGAVTPPPTGWIKFKPGNALYDPVRRLRFSLACRGQEREGTEEIWWGREHTQDLRWAGFELELSGFGHPALPRTCTYKVCLSFEPDQGGGSGA